MVTTANEERENQIASCFSQGINPRGNVTQGNEYGDDENDHNANENALAWENTDVDDDSKVMVDYGPNRNRD